MVENLAEINKYLSIHQEEVGNRCAEIFQKNNIDRDINIISFNAIIGSKNRDYNLNLSSFNTPQEYVNAWFNANETLFQKEKNCGTGKSSVRLHALLDDEVIKNYASKFLTRTFLNSKNK